ncbi:coiled-coil domain-containing protein 39-like [Brienomyrus brachyistius]|uniref:coiled-coil domain-containing protein 39-like n=1 Tax=Brienomyrus brachyistius TaxID=42636 RepID=UPI0020B2FCC9|nr:coiled-coil domain-containing protein 39-like [Brienomyrus brachyistius]
MQKKMEKTGVEKSDLTTKIEELDLFNDTSDKELKQLNRKKQDAMVEDNILKLETKRLRDLLYNKADSVLSLEKQRLWLQAVMSEREEELKLHREMICKQVRLAEQEQQALRLHRMKSSSVRRTIWMLKSARQRRRSRLWRTPCMWSTAAIPLTRNHSTIWRSQVDVMRCRCPSTSYVSDVPSAATT